MIARKSLLIMVNSIIGAVIGFFSLYFVAQYMGETILGVIGFALSFIGLFSFITSLGYDSAHIKRISEEKDLGTCLGTYISIKLVLIAIMSMLALIGILAWRIFSNEEGKSEKEFVLFIILVYYIILTLVQMMGHTFNARREIAKSQISNMTEHVTRGPLVIAIAITIPLGLTWLAGAYVIGAFASFVVALLLIRGYPIARPKKEMFKSYTRFALPVFLAAIMGTISLNIDRVMIGFFWGDDHVGYYFGSQRIIDILRHLSASLGLILFPTISYYASKNRLAEIGEVMRKAERYLSMIVFPISAFIIIQRKEIVELILGSSFVDIGAPVLAALAVFILISTLAKPYFSLISGLDRPKIIARIAVSAALINIVLNLIFIPKQIVGIRLLGLGAFGAAFATIISTLILLILYYIAANRLTGIRPGSCITKHLVAALIAGLSLIGLNYLLDEYNVWTTIRTSQNLQIPYHLGLLLILGFIVMIIYLAILIVLKEFKRNDLRFFLDLLHPGKMGKYIKDELKGEDDEPLT
ncbi:MAG: flippase [Thermoplasmata archaeon]|nr:MAG: flippase [Thermoplasmata archaeon]